MGYDSPEERQKRYTNVYLEQRLEAIQQHHRDQQWQRTNQDDLYTVIQHGLQVGYLAHRAVEALFTVVPYMHTRIDYKRWSGLLIEALTTAYATLNTSLMIQIYVQLGQGYITSGCVSGARTTFGNVIDRAETSEHDDQRLLAYIGLFKLETYDYTDHFNDAAVREALRLAHKLHDRLLLALLYEVLGGVYAHRGDVPAALGYSYTALAFWYADHNRSEIARTALMLAGAYRQSHLYAHAQLALRVAHTHIEHADNPQYKPLIAYEQAVIDFMQGRCVEAEQWLMRALSTFDALEWSHHQAMTQHMLGLVYMKTRRCALAHEALTTALRMRTHERNAFEVVNVLCDLGELEAQQGNHAEARALLNRAMTGSDDLPAMPARDTLQQHIARLLGLISGT